MLPVPKPLPGEGPLATDLASAFAGTAAADAWLAGALRSLGEQFDADRVELFGIRPETGDLVLDRTWPPTDCESRLPLESAAPMGWIRERLNRGETVAFSDRDSLPPECRDECARRSVSSGLVLPLRAGDESVGAVTVTTERSVFWPGRDLGRIHETARAIGAVLSYLVARRETERLRRGIDLGLSAPSAATDRPHSEIIGRSAAIRRVIEQIDQVASTSATVLLLGETGTGKELAARAIHGVSERRGRPMVTVNCAALPATLVEAELFGREKGAYTGALSRQAGRFEIADGSTLFLDEIGELVPEIQVKLLRVLQEGEFERIGSTRTQRVNVRLIAATNRDLAKMVREGRFREDLYYRLNVFPIRMPPLRERTEDVPLFVWSFVNELSRSLGRPVEQISEASMVALERHSWAGNVRELRNAVERAMIVHRGPILRVDLPDGERGGTPSATTLLDVERRHVQAILESTGWRIRGRNGAAEILGLKPTTLESRLVKLGLRRSP